MAPTPFSLAKENAVFFWVSVGRTAAWSPLMCASRKSPRSAEETLRSRMVCRAVSR